LAHVQKVKLPSGLIRWRARWRDGSGKARSKNFPTQGDAKQHLKSVDAGGVQGSATTTVLALARAHALHFEGLIKAGVREEITLAGYLSVLDTHIRPDGIAAKRLCDLTTPTIQGFLDRVLAGTGSVHTTRKVRRTLSTWCAFGQRQGILTTNPAKPCKVEGTSRTDGDEDRVIIPPKETLAAILAAAETPRDLAVVRMLMFGGFRISELLGMADDAVDARVKPVRAKVRERLDTRYKRLGPVKSAKSRRDVNIGSSAVVALKAWRLARGSVAPFLHTNSRGETKRYPGRLFPAPDGSSLWAYPDFIRECWWPIMERAGCLQRIKDPKGTPRPIADYGPHTLRHVAVSLWIEQGASPKAVQSRAGHARIQITMDLYGHLWTDDAADEAFADAVEALIPAKPATSPRGA
jgi:integrase